MAVATHSPLFYKCNYCCRCSCYFSKGSDLTKSSCSPVNLGGPLSNASEVAIAGSDGSMAFTGTVTDERRWTTAAALGWGIQPSGGAVYADEKWK